MSVDVSDLIGMPHRTGAHDPASGALDCAGAVMEVLRRLGRPDAARSFSMALKPKDGASDGWTEVRDAPPCEPGDVIVTDPGDGALHVAVAVTPFRAVSSGERVGVYSHPIVPPSGKLLGVYRPPAEARP